jgi:hypothetical protein
VIREATVQFVEDTYPRIGRYDHTIMEAGMCCVRRSSHQPADQYVAGEEARGETASGQAPRYSYTAFESQDQLLSHCKYLSRHAHARKKTSLNNLTSQGRREFLKADKPLGNSWAHHVLARRGLHTTDLASRFEVDFRPIAFRGRVPEVLEPEVTQGRNYQDAAVGDIELDLGVVIREVLSYPASRRCYYYSET